MNQCPPEAILRLIGTDAVGEATFASLETHVERCHHCQGILEAATKAVPPPTHLAPARGAPPDLPGLDIQGTLGSGGASAVYLAWDAVLKRHVAVKLFPRISAVDPHAREHWLAEARALSRVPHEHVVAIYQVGEADDWLWLVLEYVSGGTLKERLSEPVPPRDAARLTETIARALGYFHARGVVHLDLKPSNILLDGERGAPGMPSRPGSPTSASPASKASRARPRPAPTAPRGHRPTWPPSKSPHPRNDRPRRRPLARQIVRDYLDSADAHRALSEAHNHIKKNAIRSNDEQLEERALVHAVKASRRSLALDPDRLETRRHLDQLTEQLARINAGHEPAGSSIP